MGFFVEVLQAIFGGSGFAALDWRTALMLVIACVLLYMGIGKGFEPLLLVPIAFGMLLANLPLTGLFAEPLYDPATHSGTVGFMWVLYQGVQYAIYPSIIFMGIGAMTDFGPLLANPTSLLLGAAAQLGIFAAFLMALVLGFTPAEAAAIGVIAGLLLPISVNFFDSVLKIDDPVGAISVHGVCGAAGTVLTGLFSTSEGLLYGHGAHFLLIQCLGVACTALWAAVMITIVFQVIKHTIGLRVSQEEELKGLDITEHGLPSAYADFMPSTTLTAMPGANAFPEPVAEGGSKGVDQAVPVQVMSQPMPASDVKLSKVTVVCAQAKFEQLKSAMNDIGVTGMTVAQVLGCGIQKGRTEYYRGVPLSMNLLPKLQVDMVVSKVPVAQVVDAARKALYTGHIGDGKIFVYGVEQAVKVRTNERGYDALQGEE